MAVGADFPADAVQNGADGGVGAGDGGGGDGGAESATGPSSSKLAGGYWESESSRWTPGWRLEGAAMRWPSVGERRAGWAIGETGAAGWTIAAILSRMRNQPRNWPGSAAVAAAAGGDPLATPEAVSVGCKEVRNNCQLEPAPADGDGAEECSVAGGGAVGRLLSPGSRSTSLAIPVDWGSPSRGSAAGRKPGGLDALGAVGPPLAVARTD